MKTIVFVNTQKAGSSREALKVAKRLGYYVILLTNRDSHIQQRSEYVEVDKMIYCDISQDKIVKGIIKDLQKKGYEIETIISFVNYYGYIAAKLADEFDLGVFTTKAIVNMQNKIRSRECLKDTSYAPTYYILEKGKKIPFEEIKKIFPVVIKNPKSTGSKDVYLAHNEYEFIKVIGKMEKQDVSQLIVEQYLEGQQILVETMVVDKEIKIIGIVKQEVTYQNSHFIITGYTLLHEIREDVNQSLRKAVKEIIEHHGMENGSCHLEMRYINKEWKLIEINPRISGGAMNHLIRYGMGINLVEQILKLALKKELNLNPKFQMTVCTQYVLSSVTGRLLKVTGRNEAVNSKGVIQVYVKPRKGTIIYPPKSMGYRYAYVIASGKDEKEAEENAKTAAAKIQFHVR